ncbi:unnamed protein product [Brachionus calyciflorus]|uniref:Uncharacterized protein n=1 Tax=Brachionus calyciflorus TaxID=104777 RepID=A0A813ZT98_9BILA|nr:unnamed protein product [Brachionus calyciflorus]
MHDFIKGVLCSNFGVMMKKIKDTITVDDLNENLAKFRYGRHDSQNKIPTDLFSKNSYEKTFGFKLSATNMWSLVRIFPLIFGQILQRNIEYLHFISLIEIFKNLLSESFTENILMRLKNDKSVFLTNFKLFYIDQAIIAKQNFMVHYPNAIRKFGSP